jgi:hypothetical protein
MGRAGRPSKSGRRTKGGKRIAAAPFDHGAEHVQRLRARFAGFQDGKAGQQLLDPVGRAWAVGLLENARLDPAVLRDAGRDYAAAYWSYYPGVAGVSNYENEDRRGRGLGRADGEDPGGERFKALDLRLRDAGRACCDAVHSLCLDPYWFPDDNPAWLDRLITARLVAAGAAAAGRPGTAGDAAILRAALDGLLALAEGRRRGPGSGRL